jgi:hypothetical protein
MASAVTAAESSGGERCENDASALGGERVIDPHDETTEAAEASGTETHHEPHGGAMPHGAADDIADHGHDAHGAESSLGPIDLEAWLAGALGVALGLAIAACLVFAIS